MRSFWIGRGDRVKELEHTMADWVGAKHAVALSSGTAALVVAMKAFPTMFVSFDDDCCDALRVATRVACKWHDRRGFRIAVYPDTDGEILDFARHLPARGKVRLLARFGIFSFGALKDVTGGLGGCVVSNEPIDAGDLVKLCPMSDINASMVLSQLSRYKGKAETRLVADNKTWRMAA